MKNIEELKDLIAQNMENTNDTFVCIGKGDNHNPLGHHFGILGDDLYAYDSKDGFVNKCMGNSMGNTYYVRKDYLKQHGVNIDGDTKKTVNLKKDTPTMTFKVGDIYANKDGHLAVARNYNGTIILTHFTGPFSGQSRPAKEGEFVLVKEISVIGQI